MLHVHRAERADGLVEALRDLLAAPPPDAFAPEVVAVPTRGMERWLTQRMSSRLGASPGRGDGVCANVSFPFPRRLAAGAVAAASGVDPDEDPWRPERAVWPLLEVVDGCLHEPWLGVLAHHLGARDDRPDPLRRARRFATLRHLADLFDRYALHRPGIVEAWAAGEDGGWQGELWRRLRERIGEPGPAERMAGACARLREDPALLDLPPRVSIFGLTRLPAGDLGVLHALAAGRDVHLFLLHPSPVLWASVAAETAAGPPIVTRRQDAERTARLPRNRLLASWGQDAREMQVVLSARDALDHHHPVEHRSGTLLAALQADVRDDRPAPGPPLPGADDERLVLAPEDRSVEVHACHGRARQVEVVRDAILHLLEEDPTLEPRDVIVMCPDIETFAPLIHATFGAGEVGEDEDDLDALVGDARPPDLRVRLADRALRQTNPVLGVVAQLVDLAEQRLTASQVLDLADREPVRRRFRLGDDDLARLEEWVAESRIRWGLDQEHRAPFGLERVAHGTWRFGMDRVLAGVAMTEDDRRLVGGVLPLDDVESGAIDLAGRFAEFVDRLHAAVGRLAATQTIDAWAEAIADAADALTATSPRNAWQRTELGRLLDDVVDEAGGARSTLLAPAEVRALLGERLQGRPTRANFRTGHLTVCTLMPMRSVPHRVVCLLGLDDAVFPRRAPRDGDDLMLDEPHVGDRDARAEDRQLLLDAALAATDRLVITYTGNDERTNAERPPAVPVGELLDLVERTACCPGGASAADQVLVRHPLQPFDPRNFTEGALAGGAPWSFDRVTLAGARALAAPRAEPPPFLASPLRRDPAPVLELEELVRFVQHPVRAFLRGRLGVRVGDLEEEIEDALPVELDGLGKWGVGQRMLEARLAGCDHHAAYRAEIARGALPPARLGQRVVQEVLNVVEALVGAAENARGDASMTSADVRVVLGERVVHGTVPGVADDVLLAVVFSRLAPKHRLTAWVRFLALNASRPGSAWTAATIGRAARGDGLLVATLPPLADDAAARRAIALEHLGTLVDLLDRGMCEPPPLWCRTSAAYAEAARAGRDAARAACDEWESGFRFDKEDKEPEHVLALDGVQPFAELRAEAARDDERGRGWDAGEPTRMGRWALRLWDRLLDAERLSSR